MTDLAFGLPEVSAWAQFSGDYNPIHFDLHKARSAGLDGLVVHGMLASLPIKAALTDGTGAAASRWMKYHGVFRKPIPHGSSSLLTLQASRTSGLGFRLNAREGQEERLRGGYAPAPEQGGWLAAHAADQLRFSPLAEGDAERFLQSYPTVQEGWIVLDAIVFADFIRTKLDAIALKVRQEFPGAMGAAPERAVFVQVSHTVFIDTQALRTPGPLPFSPRQLSYAMAAPDIIADPDKVLGSVSLPIVHGQDLVMRIEIGLLARPETQQPPRNPGSLQ
ncbi:MAG: MaoC family dehydratase [Pseudomonadota bacterium]